MQTNISTGISRKRKLTSSSSSQPEKKRRLTSSSSSQPEERTKNIGGLFYEMPVDLKSVISTYLHPKDYCSLLACSYGILGESKDKYPPCSQALVSGYSIPKNEFSTSEHARPLNDFCFHYLNIKMKNKAFSLKIHKLIEIQKILMKDLPDLNVEVHSNPNESFILKTKFVKVIYSGKDIIEKYKINQGFESLAGLLDLKLAEYKKQYNRLTSAQRELNLSPIEVKELYTNYHLPIFSLFLVLDKSIINSSLKNLDFFNSRGKFFLSQKGLFSIKYFSYDEFASLNYQQLSVLHSICNHDKQILYNAEINDNNESFSILPFKLFKTLDSRLLDAFSHKLITSLYAKGKISISQLSEITNAMYYPHNPDKSSKLHDFFSKSITFKYISSDFITPAEFLKLTQEQLKLIDNEIIFKLVENKKIELKNIFNGDINDYFFSFIKHPIIKILYIDFDFINKEEILALPKEALIFFNTWQSKLYKLKNTIIKSLVKDLVSNKYLAKKLLSGEKIKYEKLLKFISKCEKTLIHEPAFHPIKTMLILLNLDDNIIDLLLNENLDKYLSTKHNNNFIHLLMQLPQDFLAYHFSNHNISGFIRSIMNIKETDAVFQEGPLISPYEELYKENAQVLLKKPRELLRKAKVAPDIIATLQNKKVIKAIFNRSITMDMVKKYSLLINYNLIGVENIISCEGVEELNAEQNEIQTKIANYLNFFKERLSPNKINFLKHYPTFVLYTLLQSKANINFKRFLKLIPFISENLSSLNDLPEDLKIDIFKSTMTDNELNKLYWNSKGFFKLVIQTMLENYNEGNEYVSPLDLFPIYINQLREEYFLMPKTVRVLPKQYTMRLETFIKINRCKDKILGGLINIDEIMLHLFAFHEFNYLKPEAQFKFESEIQGKFSTYKL